MTTAENDLTFRHQPNRLNGPYAQDDMQISNWNPEGLSIGVSKGNKFKEVEIYKKKLETMEDDTFYYSRLIHGTSPAEEREEQLLEIRVEIVEEDNELLRQKLEYTFKFNTSLQVI